MKLLKKFWNWRKTKVSIERGQILVDGLSIEIIRKPIKNLHLGVYPPNGRVRVAAPLAVTNEAVRLAVVGKLGWIKRQRARFESQSRQSDREYVSGESHYFFGARYRLRLIQHNGVSGIVLRNRNTMELYAKAKATTERREKILQRWYRKELNKAIAPLMDKWEAAMGVEVLEWRIKKMKTRWGTCNTRARRIWLNLELAKKPVHCLEYIIVHELAHLLERSHNEKFIAIVDAHLPDWRTRRQELNAAPLAHETWGY
jgi:predicted metal-dependent hydrolase